MHQRTRQLIYVSAAILTVLVLAALFLQRAFFNLTHEDFRNANFFFFWLAGRMILLGQNPYDSVQWIAGHDAFGNTWRPNLIFPYPLPLAVLMAPLGLLSLPAAYFSWQLLSEILMGVSVWYLLRHWFGHRQDRLYLPLMIALLYFGPVYLSLQIGGLAPIILMVLVLALILVDRGHAVAGGVLLSLTMLKPPLGMPLLVLAVFWFVVLRDRSAIVGMVIGGLALLGMGMLVDPLWVVKFVSAGQLVLDRTLGVQSNVFSFAYLACGHQYGCMLIWGTAGMTVILALTGYYLWRHRQVFSTWDAFNLIIPIGFLSALYLWSYDQVPYVIPIVWLTGTLVERTRSYLPSFALAFALVAISLVGLAIQAYTRQDLISVIPTLIVTGASIALLETKGAHPVQAVT